MSQISSARYANPLLAMEGLRNWRAVLFLFLGLLLGSVIGITGWALPTQIEFGFFSHFLAFVCYLLAFVVAGTGTSAAGIVLMDQAQKLPLRSFALILFDGFLSFARIVAVALIGGVVVLAFFIVATVLLLLCKIPGIGPAFYALFFPILAVASGLLLFGLFVVFSMAGPAVWSGTKFQGVLAMLWQIVTRRTVELLVGLFLLALLIGLVSLIITGILSSGIISMAGFSAAILGENRELAGGYLFGLAGLSMFDLLDFAGIFASWERLSNYLTAAFLGMGVLYSLVLSALCAMWWMGCNLVYLGVSSELDPEATERLIGERLEAAKRKAQQLKAESQRRHDEALEARRRAQEAKANEAGEQEKDESSPAGEEAREVPATAATAATTAKATATCPQCQAPISPGDRFCGTCGQPLS